MIRVVSTQAQDEITVQIEVRARRVSVSGCLEMRTGPVLVQTVCAVLRPSEDIVVDLHLVRFIDAAGMGSLVQLNNVLRSTGRRLLLEAVSARHSRLLTVAGLGYLLRADEIGPASRPFRRAG